MSYSYRNAASLAACLSALLCMPTLLVRADDNKPVQQSAVPAKADDTKSVPQSVAPVTPAPYLLAGDDVIGISVVNFTNLSVPQITLPPDGKLTVPLLDSFSVIGKTTDEVAQMLTEKWKRYVIHPAVSVALIQKRKVDVLVYGAVQRPGAIEYKPPMRVLEALAQAGGPLLQNNQVVPQGVYLPQGDLTHVVVTHKNGSKQPLDLSHPEERGGTPEDILLEPGDVVYVPERRTQISVMGDVQRPGTVEYKENMTVEDAVTGADGFGPLADLTNATLTHEGKETKLDLQALYERGDTQYNVKLMPGDQLLIPEIRNRTFVLGAVAKPGAYAFKEGDRVLDALHSAGSPLPNANLTQITLVHIAKDKRSATVDKINLEKLLKKGDVKLNMKIVQGDVLYVPEKKLPMQNNSLWSLLTGVGLVEGFANIIRN